MKDAPISPTLKVRDHTIEPPGVLETGGKILMQMQQGAKVMPQVVAGLWGRATGAPLTDAPRPFKKGTPPATMPADWQRGVAIAAAQARARMPDMLRSRRFRGEAPMTEEEIAMVTSGALSR